MTEREAFECWFRTTATYRTLWDFISTHQTNIKSVFVKKNGKTYQNDCVQIAWEAWQAKAQAVPEGFVLVEKAKIKTWFQDDDEPENFCSEESEIADLADPYETGEIIKINRIEDCVISVTPLYGTWKIDRIDQEGDVHRSFVLCDLYYEAEKVIVSNKEVDDEWLLAQQAQEPANDN